MMNRESLRCSTTAVENSGPPLDKGRLEGSWDGLIAIKVPPRQPFADFWRQSQVLLLVLIFTATTGQIWRDKVSRKNAEGNALYQQKNYPGALDKYVEANDGKAHRQELAYNLANTFYQQKKYPEALRELEKAVASGNSPLNEKIYFNRGNTFFQMGKYQEAIESYKKALELVPSDKEAKHNLELALKKLHENPQEQKKDSKKKDQQSKQDKQDQKQGGSSDQQKQQKPSQPKDQQNQPQNANKSEEDKKQPQPGQQQKAAMDSKEALRILDALNQQEKQEQRKQALKIQRERVGGKDW
jgi:tetratricopeptide (TPR) repeat protein